MPPSYKCPVKSVTADATKPSENKYCQNMSCHVMSCHEIKYIIGYHLTWVPPPLRVAEVATGPNLPH